jgi:hypothetical protein
MAIDPDLDFRSQVKKIEFEKLAQNSKSLAASFSAASRESNNFIQKLILNNKAISAQQKSISQQIIADNAQLRLNNERSRLLNDDNNRLKRSIQQKQAEAELIATTGRDSRGRFAGATDIDRLSTEANTLTSQYQGQVLTQRSLMAESDGLEQSMSQSGKQLKGLKMQGFIAAADDAAAVMKKFSAVMLQLVNSIYKTQQDLTVQMGTATDVLFDAQMSVIKSYIPFTGGPILNRDEIVNAFASFKKEFGTILSSEEAVRIAEESKRLGVSSDTYVKARRAFLGTGVNAEAVRMRAMSEFAKNGLSAGQALQFAADNADLLAVAGEKYSDSLFRAAAESKKIGVNLRDIEKFANSVVGDFEGSLENFAELSALGVELDFNKLAQVSATGTTDEIKDVLSQQLSMSGITGEELQRNRQVRLALTQTTGFDEATILRLAGVSQQPTEQTVEEKQVTLLSSMSENIAKIAQILAVVLGGVAGGLAGFAAGGPIGAAIGAIAGGYGATKFATGGLVRGTGTSTSDSIPAMLSDGEYVLNAEATRKIGVGTLSTLNTTASLGGSPPRGGVGGGLVPPAIAGTKIPLTPPAVGGAALVAAPGLVPPAIAGTKIPLTPPAVGGAALGAAALVAAPGLAVLGGLSSVGSLVGRALGLIPTTEGQGTVGKGKAAGGLITGPGTSTSDNILTPSSPGEFVVNAKATQAYGSDMLNKINTGTYTPEKQIVTNNTKIDTTRLEEKLDKLINRLSGMKVEMNGYEVGHVSFNEARTPLRVR